MTTYRELNRIVLRPHHPKQFTKKDDNRFGSLRNAEFNRLIDCSVFSLVSIAEAKHFRIYGGLIFEKVENDGKQSAYEKSGFMIQAFNDSNNGFPTYALTVQCVLQRLLLMLCAMGNNLVF